MYQSVTVQYVDVYFPQQAKSQFKRRSTANNVEISVPVPLDADSPKFKVMDSSNIYMFFIVN